MLEHLSVHSVQRPVPCLGLGSSVVTLLPELGDEAWPSVSAGVSGGPTERYEKLVYGS